MWSAFLSHGTVLTAAAQANLGGRMSRLPESLPMQDDVRTFIRNRCETRTRTTATDVMHLLAEKKYLSVDAAIDDSNNAVLRTVQRFLKKSVYARGSHKGKTLWLAPANHLARAEYVHKMTSSEILLHRVVYMDESYIYHHYSRHNDSLVDPTDAKYVKEKYKGRRLCFIAAILDKDRTVSDEERTPEQAAELLLDSVDVFEGGQQKADYHSMFCHDYFVNWMDTLLQALENRGLTGCIIAMDNAKYHKALPDSAGQRRGDDPAPRQDPW
ncbi:unnamed protein product [Phytophthora fragariaefolia]|uniref:Unnamed protein product n=1 Tax=Phytophthora fragariaefolia TaxID=1490495 RepID=A0A9W6Y6F6_9STRA|nr:unnamed protein product [Phytophthora fragariaefolia]